MKKILPALACAILFVDCSKKEKRESDDSEVRKSIDSVFAKSYVRDCLTSWDSVSRAVKANHQKLKDIKGDLNSFKRYLSQLSNSNASSIPFALDYIKTCISPSDVDRDSIFYWFNAKFYSVTNRLSDSLYTKYKPITLLLEKASDFEELGTFKINLAKCGIGVFSSEGTFYFDVISDFFYDNFKDRVSEGVKEYLVIRKDELKEGFSEDAGLLISFDELYQRVKSWELYLAEYPNTIYSPFAKGLYQTYLETLITGMDNSRIFDSENNKLKPEIKSLYEKIVREDPDLKSAQIISTYYNFLSKYDFKGDSVQRFLKANDLSTMLAVQPDSR